MVKAVGRRRQRFSRTSPDALTRQQYEDLQFAQEFRRRRGDHPRPYERRLLRQLIATAKARRRARHLNGRDPLLILDLGTGYGRDLAWLQAQPGVHAVGVDYAFTMLRLGYDEFPVAAGTLVQMDVQRLGFKSRSIDVVRAQALFHHLSPSVADRAMRDVARVMKPHGLVRMFVRRGTWQGMLDEPGLGSRYFHYFTLKKLRALLQRHGLRLVRHETVIAYPRLPCLAILAEKTARAR